MSWFDQALYVTPDTLSLREAEYAERRELLAQSAVVRHARVEQTHVSFWRAVDARQAQRPVLRLQKGAR